MGIITIMFSILERFSRKKQKKSREIAKNINLSKTKNYYYAINIGLNPESNLHNVISFI